MNLINPSPGGDTGGATPTPTAPTIEEIIKARGSRDEQALQSIETLRRPIAESEAALNQVFDRMDNAYDRIFWVSLANAADPRRMIEAFASALSRGMPIAEAAAEIGREVDLDDRLLRGWQRLEEVLEEIR